MYTIQWHVDYWNYLGYRDPFSHPDHARRQRAYARAAGRRGVFTPHVLVNGETLRPVSAARLRSAIDDAIDESRPRAARIVRFDYDASASRLQYETTDAGDVALELLVVLVEDDLSSADIPRGENAGRTLHHHGTARWWTTLAPGDGSVSVDKIPSPVDRAHAHFIAVLQEKATRRFHAAVRRDIP